MSERDTWARSLGGSWPAQVDIIIGGRTVTAGTKPRAALVFRTHDEARTILTSREAMVIGEAYVSGRMDIEGDIYAVIDLKDWLQPADLTLIDRAKIVYRALRARHKHAEEHDGEYIRHHYDHPDQFYSLFLGRTMTYSCAYFTDPDGGLDFAQDRKLDHILGKLRLKPGERLLDIGCGWGSLVIKAAAEYGAEALGVTLSPSQYSYARSRIAQLGLEAVCRVELEDYRQITSESFDKIVSVGMYEHVGSANLGTYFAKMQSLLREDGLFLNHGITRKIDPDWRKASEALFLDKYIFPGGELHAVSRVTEGMERAGFEVFDAESLRQHYALTLRHWVRNLQNSRQEAQDLVPESTIRAWLIYMAGCARSFEEGYLNIHQVSGSKTLPFGGSGIALTREHLYRERDQNV